MEDVAESVLAFIRWTDEHPLPPNAPTRVVLNALRVHLDAAAPGWRAKVFEQGAEEDALEVEVHLTDGRLVRGALFQLPSVPHEEA